MTISDPERKHLAAEQHSSSEHKPSSSSSYDLDDDLDDGAWQQEWEEDNARIDAEAEARARAQHEADEDHGPVSGRQVDDGDSWDPAHAEEVGARDPDQETPASPPPREIGVLDMGDDEDWIEPRRRLYGNHFCKGVLSGLIGVGAAGKTSVRIVQALAIASGRSLTGEKVWKRGRVLYLCMEDNLTELRRRFRAAMLFYQITKEELREYMYIACIKSAKLGKIDPKTRTIKQGELYQLLLDTIKKLNIDLVILDPFVKLHDAHENDNSAIDAVATMLNQIAEVADCAVDILHHVKKGGVAAGDSDAARGAGSLRDAGRLFRTLTTMSPEEARDLDLKPEERRSFVRIDDSKVNFAPTEAQWFQLVGVPLGNATDDYPEGDNIQTAKSWTPPAKEIGGLAPTVGEKILDEIDKGPADGGRYSASPNAHGPTSAVHAVWLASPNHPRPEAQNIIRRLFAEQRIYEADYRTADRKSRKGLFVRGGKVKPGNVPSDEPRSLLDDHLDEPSDDREDIPF
jgi:hypothetical protein